MRLSGAMTCYAAWNHGLRMVEGRYSGWMEGDLTNFTNNWNLQKNSPSKHILTILSQCRRHDVTRIPSKKWLAKWCNCNGSSTFIYYTYMKHRHRHHRCLMMYTPSWHSQRRSPNTQASNIYNHHIKPLRPLQKVATVTSISYPGKPLAIQRFPFFSKKTGKQQENNTSCAVHGQNPLTCWDKIPHLILIYISHPRIFLGASSLSDPATNHPIHQNLQRKWWQEADRSSSSPMCSQLRSCFNLGHCGNKG